MSRLNFSDFLQSRNQLLQAAAKNPNVCMQYTVTKYCKIPLGESKEQREYVSLKPKDVITVEWLYDDGADCDPSPSSIKVNEHNHSHFYTYERLLSWLQTNTETNRQNWII